jgi:hypothetical protein
VFYSNNDSNKEPTVTKHTKSNTNPKNPISLFEHSESENFRTHFIYFTLYSATGCLVNILTSFAPEREKKILLDPKTAEENAKVWEEDMICI